MLSKSAEYPGLTVFRLRLTFRVLDPIHFPALLPANVFRGAFGLLDPFPSGQLDDKNRPSPYVLRSRHLDGLSLSSGERFHLDVHLFTLAARLVDRFIAAFSRCDTVGLGPLRSRVVLEHVSEPFPLESSLLPRHTNVRKVRVNFVTPTELKHHGNIVEQPSFPILLARACQRLHKLHSWYGTGPSPIDFHALYEQATQIRLEGAELRHRAKKRHSSRTGQVHPLGGFVGFADYTGLLDPFLPYLEATQWTGVGRQTVWGKGETTIDFLSSAASSNAVT